MYSPYYCNDTWHLTTLTDCNNSGFVSQKASEKTKKYLFSFLVMILTNKPASPKFYRRTLIVADHFACHI